MTERELTGMWSMDKGVGLMAGEGRGTVAIEARPALGVTMSGGRRMTEAERLEAIRKWSETPSVNPRYRGATPADMVRALRGRVPVSDDEAAQEEPGSVKTALSSPSEAARHQGESPCCVSTSCPA